MIRLDYLNFKKLYSTKYEAYIFIIRKFDRNYGKVLPFTN